MNKISWAQLEFKTTWEWRSKLFIPTQDSVFMNKGHQGSDAPNFIFPVGIN